MKIAIVGFLAMILMGLGTANAVDSNSQMATEIKALQKQVDALQAILKYVSVDTGTENGLKGPHLIFKGVNVHIENGSGSTAEANGLGNLVIGYDEDNASSTGNTSIDDARTGSHILVIGPGHEFVGSGGFVAGYQNSLLSNYDSVPGGVCNAAGDNARTSCEHFQGLSLGTGEAATVGGGSTNIASGDVSSVSGGVGNAAAGLFSSISGGNSNTASGVESSVSGGESSTASAHGSTVSGGGSNFATGTDSSVGGGFGQTAAGTDQNIN